MLWVGLAEPVEVPKRAAAPGEDRLVIIPDDREVAVRFRQQAQQLELRVVCVLELVHQDVAEPRSEARCRRGVLAQEAKRQCDLVAEVDDAVPLLDPVVRLVGCGELLVHRRLVCPHVGIDRITHRGTERVGMSDVRLGRNVLIARATKKIEKGPNVSQRIPRRTIPLERERDLALLTAVEVLANQDHLLRR